MTWWAILLEGLLAGFAFGAGRALGQWAVDATRDRFEDDFK